MPAPQVRHEVLREFVRADEDNVRAVETGPQVGGGGA